MNDTEVSRAQLLEALRAGAGEVRRRVEATDATTLDSGEHESGWNGRQILAHLSASEWTYPRILEAARAEAAGGEPEARPAGFDLDTYNQNQVAKRDTMTVAELLEEFETNRAATIAAVESIDDAVLARPRPARPGAGGTVGQFLLYVALTHVRNHLADIDGSAEVTE